MHGEVCLIQKIGKEILESALKTFQEILGTQRCRNSRKNLGKRS